MARGSMGEGFVTGVLRMHKALTQDAEKAYEVFG
jgi:hypothetical protein